MTGNEVYPIYRKVQLPSAVLIVHKRTGRGRIRSLYDIKLGHKGYWGTVCSSNRSPVNVTTKWEEVTCLRCLKKGNR
jgi:hypothetical protein